MAGVASTLLTPRDPDPYSMSRPTTADLPPALWRRLSSPSTARGLAALAFDWAVVAGSLLVVEATGRHPLAIGAAWIAVGWAQHALVILGHEAAHRTLVNGASLNRFIGRWLTWGAVGVPFEGYKRLHLPHHRLAGGPGDPEHRVLPARPYRARFRPSTPWRAALLSLLGGGLGEFLAFSRETRARTLGELAPPVLLTAGAWGLGLLLGAVWAPALWTVSSLTSLFLFSRLRTFGEHLGSDWTHRIAAPRWLRPFSHPHHVDLHWEHHRWPSIPGFRLEEARRAVGGVPVEGLVAMWARRT